MACAAGMMFCQSVSAEPVASSESALVDGNCTEYTRIAAEFSHGVTAYIKQNADHVWLCFTLPAGSSSAGEFILRTPGLATPLVLHVSAQLGQWPLGNEELRPKEGTSSLWWNNTGWAAIPARFNGMEQGDDGPQPRFLPATGQEFQFSRTTFGPGPWTLGGGFYAVSDGEGDRAPARLDDDNGQPLLILRGN
ncbi:hypothetical protein [Erythrobacter sp. JK5]|uniref:hypothetical protein n=1 Tax=Erythrobacter sp. JK5 TaxID=2829500 RepID=UPI001BA90CD9|nr:hypothetical protein [Erythrobacter sp. JK5]QUL37853.1 hypothetical protein KDC96_16260 [Erythrobacter sp. JK5]